MRWRDVRERQRKRRRRLAETYHSRAPKVCFAYFPRHIRSSWVWLEHYLKVYHSSYSGVSGHWWCYLWDNGVVAPPAKTSAGPKPPL